MANKPKPITSMREMYPALFASMDREIREAILRIDTESLLWGVDRAPFIGPVQGVAPIPPPEAPSLCTCGAELMGERAVSYKMCGDCQGLWCQGSAKPVVLDQRIAEVQPPKVDKDPTEAWGAGQTPGYEWP